jgi:hypothetical protein
MRSAAPNAVVLREKGAAHSRCLALAFASRCTKIGFDSVASIIDLCLGGFDLQVEQPQLIASLTDVTLHRRDPLARAFQLLLVFTDDPARNVNLGRCSARFALIPDGFKLREVALEELRVMSDPALEIVLTAILDG